MKGTDIRFERNAGSDARDRNTTQVANSSSLELTEEEQAWLDAVSETL